MNYSFPWVNQSDRRLPPPEGKKSGAARGLWGPSAETCDAPALVTPAQAALRHPDKPGAGLSHSLCSALSRVCSSPPEVQCTAFCIFTALYFKFSNPSVFQCNLEFRFLQVKDLFFHRCGKLSCTPKIA